MGADLIARAEEVLATLGELLPETPEFLFVSEYRDEDGNREYEGLWVLTERYVSEAEQFVSRGDFDLVRRDIGLGRVFVERRDYDLGTPTDASRLTVTLNFNRNGAGLVATLKASGSNCADLSQILREYVVPTLNDAGE